MIIIQIIGAILIIKAIYQFAYVKGKADNIKDIQSQLHDRNVEQEIRRHHQLEEDKEITDTHITNYFLEGE